MFCKGCIFEHLLTQKEEIKEQMRKWTLQQEDEKVRVVDIRLSTPKTHVIFIFEFISLSRPSAKPSWLRAVLRSFCKPTVECCRTVQKVSIVSNSLIYDRTQLSSHS